MHLPRLSAQAGCWHEALALYAGLGVLFYTAEACSSSPFALSLALGKCVFPALAESAELRNLARVSRVTVPAAETGDFSQQIPAPFLIRRKSFSMLNNKPDPNPNGFQADSSYYSATGAGEGLIFISLSAKKVFPLQPRFLRFPTVRSHHELYSLKAFLSFKTQSHL